MNNSYSHKEVTAILNIAGSTVYKLVNEQILEIASTDKNINSSRRYTKQSVDAAKKIINPDIPGLKVAEFARKYNYSAPRVYTAIKKIGITVDTITINKTEVMYLSEENQAILLKELSKQKHKGEKRTFYNKEAGIALYQRFMDSKQGIHRVVINESNEWGIVIDNQFIIFKEAQEKLCLESCYSISHLNFTQKNGAYVDFLFSKPSKLFETFLDFTYSYFGIENMHLKINEKKEFELSIKEATVESDQLKDIDLSLLKQHLIDGEIKRNENNQITFSSQRKVLTVRVSRVAEDLLHKEYLKTNKSYSELLDDLIRKHLE